jgi:hypothetical protein
MSFNRPQFLGPVLKSLKAQRGVEISAREVHLFQDGAVNRYSRLRYALDSEIERSVALFRSEFPNGIVHQSTENIGICENFRRAEEYVYVERQFDCAWFFEDDLVISPVYFQMMERLQQFAEAMGGVAYFSAYGHHYASPEERDERRRELVTLDHHWGFGLLRRHWESMQPHLQDYYKAVLGQDYSRRDHRRIFSLYESERFSPRASSQDAAKAYACNKIAVWRCNTFVTFAKYIGTSGQHMTPTEFEGLGFGRTTVADEPILDISFPSSSKVREMVLDQRTLFGFIRESEFGSIIKGLPPRQFNPSRLCTREEVRGIYYLLLRRDVEEERIYAEHVSKTPVMNLVEAIRNSTEFQGLTIGESPEFTFYDCASRQLCSRDDIFLMYALLTHREPEDELISEHVGQTYIDSLLQGVLRSREFTNLVGQFSNPAGLR